MITLICQQCNKEFPTYESHRKRRKFCSRECKDASLKGKPFFDSTGMPAWNKGRKLPYQVWHKGRTGIFSQEARQKMSEAHKELRGERHSCWRACPGTRWFIISMAQGMTTGLKISSCIPAIATT